MNLLIKPASGSCNLRCRYCFYADEMTHRETANLGMMSPRTAENTVKFALDNSVVSCSFMFQGGEPTLRGLEFYENFVGLVKKYNEKHLPVSFAIQTNGYSVDDDFAKFFAENDFLVGLSLDGPKFINDQNRVDAKGVSSFDRVLETVGAFEKYGVKYNILAVVTSIGARNAAKIRDFFAEKHFTYQQFIPCLDPLNGSANVPALTDRQYGDFLCRAFDLWYADILKGQYVYNRTFENYMMILLGGAPENCGMAGKCSVQYVVEADGSVYPCDFYVLDGYKLGNVNENSVSEMDQRREEIGFVERSEDLPDECRDCRWLKLCRGGCYRERIPDTNGVPKNRFCVSYKQFLAYSYDRLNDAARKILAMKYGK